MEILNQGFDHVEFVVRDFRHMGTVFERLGFEKVGERSLPKAGTKSALYCQGLVRILLTCPTGSNTKSESINFLNKHAEGVCVLAIEVKDATQAFNETVKRGARPAREPEVFETPQGTVVRSEIWDAWGCPDAFIQRHISKGLNHPALFDEELVATRLESPSPLGIRQIDHLTNNVGIGEMKNWVAYYKEIFGFGVTRHFDINTQRTGSIS